jgi:peptidoglycan/xylan/chitin deacetylase (PgdA/CDA1 family)
MLRGLIKTGVASAVQWSGTNSLLALRPGMKQMPLVVGYHRVVENFHSSAAYAIAPMLISLRTFEHQLDWIGRRFEYVTLDDIADAMEGKRRFTRPVAAITFDDGYVDVYRHAFPLLQRKGIPWALFVVTGCVGTPILQTYDELYLLLADGFKRWHEPRRHLHRLLLGLEIPVSVLKRLDPNPDGPVRAAWTLIENLSQQELRRLVTALCMEGEIPAAAAAELGAMSWEMLQEMSQAGVIVGSHTRTHPFLPLEKWNRMLDETRGSREELQRRLGKPVDHFTYPSGAFDSAVVTAVATAGYRSAYTACQHRDPRYPELTIPRRLLWENSCMSAFGHFSPALMNCQVNGVFDFVPSCRQAHSF